MRTFRSIHVRLVGPLFAAATFLSVSFLSQAASAQEMPCLNARAERTAFAKITKGIYTNPCGERGPRRGAPRPNDGPQVPVSISGHVTHQNGVRMVGVTMSLTDQDTGAVRTVVTDDTGSYLFDNIEWGSRVELMPSLENYEFYPPAVIWEGIVEDEIWNFIAVGPPPPPPPPPANQPILAWSSFFDNTPQLADFNGLVGRDSQGNVYTGGTSYMEDDTFGNTDIVLYKTDPNGNRVWAKTFDGPGGYKDGIRDMAVDPAGNVYIAGYSYSPPEGTSGLRSYNFVTLKYNTDGELVWSRFYGPNEGYDDFARSLKIDGSGNVYVGGYSWGVNVYANYATVKYDADGNEVWARRYAGGNGEILNEVELDALGNVYITGYSNSSAAGGSENIITIKYDPAGEQMWLNSYDSPSHDSDEGRDIEIDANGDVLVLAETFNFEGYSTVIHKIDGVSGSTVWTRPVSGITADRSYNVSAIELSPQGGLILTGMLFDDVSYNVDAFIAKLSSEIATEWVREYDGPGDEDYDGDPAMVIDGDGNIVMAVTSEGFANADIQIIKYAANGTEQWTYRFGNPFFGDDVVISWDSEASKHVLLLDPQGNVYVAGSSYIPNQSTDLVTFKLEPVGQTRAAPFDFDGDRKADISVFRPETGDWYVLNSGDQSYSVVNWGLGGDKLTPADYDGDGRYDAAVFRDGTWYARHSSSGRSFVRQFGTAGDVPAPTDFDNDGHADLNVFRQGVWHSLASSNSAYHAVNFGLATDLPIPGDYDSNRRSDLAVFREGTWYVQYESGLPMASIQFGVSADKVVPADYDGDRKTDYAVFRQGVWYIWESSARSTRVYQWGIEGDIPVPADYDGDRKADLAVFRQGVWYILRSSDGGLTALQFGLASDIPLPSVYNR